MFCVVKKISEPICVVFGQLFFRVLWQRWQSTHIGFELDNLVIILGLGRLAWPTIIGFRVPVFLVVVHARGDRGIWNLFTVRELRGPLLELLSIAFGIRERNRLRNWYETSYEQRIWTTTQLKNGSPCMPLQCLYRKRHGALGRNSVLLPADFHPWWSWDCIWQASRERDRNPI